MTDWTAGYMADIPYIYGYYSELNPLFVQLAFLNAGLALPQNGTACELGFGQGVSINMHAAASTTRWYGNDFNPSQAAFAQELAAASGAGADLSDEAFEEFCKRPDLPDFDYISMHGIWSWISDANRTIIVDFVRRKLKVGGVLYVSYNTQPGWAAMVPMRDLLSEYSEVMDAPGHGVAARIDNALDFADRLMATDPVYARQMPQVAKNLANMKSHERSYLAHEYFNRDWHPMSFSRMAKWLAPAKLEYACPAKYLDHVESIDLTPAQQQFLNEIPSTALRETTRDFMTGQTFRRDYWVKGKRTLSAFDQAEALRRHRVMLVTPRDRVVLQATGSVKAAGLAPQVYQPILDFLAGHQPRSIGQIEAAVRDAGVVFPLLVQALMVLAGKRDLVTVQDEQVTAAAKPRCEKLNEALIAKARGANVVGSLASPVTGGGIPVGRFEQLFLLARQQGQNSPQEWARFVWTVLAAQGQRLSKDGRPLESAEENIAQLGELAETFSERDLPILKALGVAS
ncbi:class I SAM-dependent methyltransferase [Massilia terrae]|uniref:Methyltransferase regulatory domain-containing protein n=1 Tax=Massilia terrae TaxID=1811224 RepID=A0ABT2D426_9BURK|nr:methyltransferase regulatory domain-containing protein [Massilia terrae]MCS0660999.1 methyltransferase regulatory domain-containing protein [Massilia terrae]